MKKICCFILGFVLFYKTYAQDIIYKNDGSEIKSIVTEITADAVKYKNYSQPDGPIRNILIKDVFMIIYKDGSKEIFKGNHEQADQPSDKRNSINTEVKVLDENELKKYSFHERKIIGNISLKGVEEEGVFSGNDKQIHKYQVKFHFGVFTTTQYVNFWIDGKFVLNENSTAAFKYYFVNYLPSDPFFIICSKYDGPNIIISKLQPYLSQDILPIPLSQKNLLDAHFTDYTNIRSWTYFFDANHQAHHINIIGFYKVNGRMQFDVYLDNNPVSKISYKFNSGWVNYELEQLEPKVQISIKGDKNWQYDIAIGRM
jgi:hypothetical protein